MASYQVDREAVDAFRAATPGDVALVELASWASFTASVRAAEWMVVPGAKSMSVFRLSTLILSRSAAAEGLYVIAEDRFLRVLIR